MVPNNNTIPSASDDICGNIMAMTTTTFLCATGSKRSCIYVLYVYYIYAICDTQRSHKIGPYLAGVLTVSRLKRVDIIIYIILLCTRSACIH